ncbi:hypothetical protein HHI36_008935 [Cryptolaemus montrouzieri]|uniref:Uncharacterized protein n=1 Tax=Cryptolaemus montrouzieri TaxID=559131 RepID=A0ABD2MU13_9CUCU
MNQCYFIISCFLLLALVDFGQSIVCTKDICSTVKCANANPCTCKGPNKFIKDGFCGCCKICFTYLDEGESCPLEIRGPSPPTSGCKEGLKCKEGKCRSDDC